MMADRVRAPCLLDANFHESARLRPTALSLDLETEDASSARITLPPQADALPIGAWIELFTLKGSAGYYHVTQDTEALGKNLSYVLRHGIHTLHDSLWKEQRDFSGTMQAYLTALLAQQTAVYWQLGVCEDSGAWKKSGINYDHLDDLLNEVRAERQGYLFTYDFTTTPWTLNFVSVPGAVSAEMRPRRNLENGRIIRTRDGLVNRLYLSVHTTRQADTAPATWSGGANKGQATGNTTAAADKTTETETVLRVYNNTASQDAYGIVEGPADVDTADVPDVDAWAAAFLQDHAAPISQASADAFELVKSTGEEWDSLDLGKVARIAGRGVEKRIVRLQYPDLVSTPALVHADLNRPLPKFSESIADLRKKTSRAAAAAKSAARSAAKDKEVTHWAKTVQEIKEALDGTGLTDLWETGIELDTQTGARLYSLYQGMSSSLAEIALHNGQIDILAQKTGIDQLNESETLYTKITIAGAGLEAEITRATAAEGTLSASISATAEELSTLFTKTGVNGLGQNETLFSRFNQTAEGLNSQVTALGTKVDKKSTIYRQWTDPASEAGNEVKARDIWIKTNAIRTYADMGTVTNQDLSSYQHRDMYGSKLYVRNASNSAWELQNDEATTVEQGTDIVQTKQQVSQVAWDLSTQKQETAELKVTAQEISAAVTRVTDDQTAMQGQLSVQADKIGLVVQETSGGNVIKAASIVAAINNTGSSVAIDADKVTISGETSISDILTISSGEHTREVLLWGDVTVRGNLYSPYWATLYGLTIADGESVSFESSGGASFRSLSYSTLGGMIESASVSGNTLTLTKFNGTTINFSKATPSDINIGNASWGGSTLESGRTVLSALSSVINNNTGNTGYVYFDAYLSGDSSNVKKYAIRLAT